MADPRFFRNAGPIMAARLAELSGARLEGNMDGETLLDDVAALVDAGPFAVSFLASARYRHEAAHSAAGLVVTDERGRSGLGASSSALVTSDPQLAFARIASAFYPQDVEDEPVFERDESRFGHAFIDRRATIAGDVRLGPGAVILAGAEIGEGAVIGPHSSIGSGVVVGARARLGAGVRISHALLGEDVHVQAGAVIGEAGFGFAMNVWPYADIPQLGRVIVEKGARIGANVTIHRGSLGDTRIGANSLIDNLVMLAHNVHIGEGAVIVAQTGISGSSEIGAHAVLGGQTGVAGHLHIGARARLAARSGVTRDIPAGAVCGGFPAQPVARWRREIAALRRLARRMHARKGEEADE